MPEPVSGGGAISDGPLEGAVEVDWDRPLDEWETAFKDELFYWGPFFRGLGHGHMYLDANAKYALARIAGILHRQALDASEARAEAAERQLEASHLRLGTAEVVVAAARVIAAAPPALAVTNREARQLVSLNALSKLNEALAAYDAQPQPTPPRRRNEPDTGQGQRPGSPTLP